MALFLALIDLTAMAVLPTRLASVRAGAARVRAGRPSTARTAERGRSDRHDTLTFVHYHFPSSRPASVLRFVRQLRPRFRTRSVQ